MEDLQHRYLTYLGCIMASYLPLPHAFQQSYLDKDSYPRNLVERTVGTYPSALKEYAERLAYSASNLCYVPDANETEVSIYDLQADNGARTGLLIDHIYF